MRVITTLLCAMLLASCTTAHSQRTGIGFGAAALGTGIATFGVATSIYDDPSREPSETETANTLTAVSLVLAAVGTVTLIATLASAAEQGSELDRVAAKEEAELMEPVALSVQCDQLDGGACYEIGRSFLNGDPQNIAAACQSFAAACSVAHELGCLALDSHCAATQF